MEIDYLRQRKDTALLCLDGCHEGDPEDDGPEEAWDSPHPTDDVYEHGQRNCVRASIAMIVTNYGGSLSQDRIAFEENGGGEPGLDLAHDKDSQTGGLTGAQLSMERRWPVTVLLWAGLG